MSSPPNPYRPPSAPVTPPESDGLVPRSRALKFAAAVVAVTATLSAGIAPVVLNSFREIFAGFGAALPPLSQTILDSTWRSVSSGSRSARSSPSP